MTRPADGLTSVPHALAHWARERGPDTAFTFLGAGNVVDRVVTYAGLADEVARVAAFLHGRVRPGDRALLLFPPGGDYLAAFLGCLSAGVVAVPLYPPRPGAKLDRITAVVDDCGASLALTSDALVPLLADLPVPVHAIDSLAAAAPVSSLPAADDLAFLQYTSGSTGAPKGVMVSHANLVANLRAIETGFGVGPTDVVLSWLPMYHDMGLIGTTLLPLFTGTPAVLLSTFEFVRDPLCWPLAVAAFGATCSGGPDFAYRLLAERYDAARLSGVDLSRWRVAFNGAEPVRAATMATMTERYAAHGFSSAAWVPCYGLAEATLFVAGTTAGYDTAVLDGRDVVSSGIPAVDTTVVVVDADGQPALDGTVGEILVQSPGVAQGYWGNPTASDTAFRATVAGHAGTFLRTGDLGAIVGGAVHVAGRVKDLIIVGGRNHHPHDVEAAATDPRLRASAAFQVADGVVLVAEVIGAAVRSSADEVAALASAVRRAVSVDCGLELADVVFVRPNSILKTSSGKIRRAATRERYEHGQLKPIGPATTTAAPRDLRGVLVEKIGFALDPADAARPLAALGLDSMKLMALKGAAEAATGTRFPAELFFGDASLDDVLAAEPLPAEPLAVVPDSCPATDSQLQMLFHDQIHPDDRSNTLATALRLDRRFAEDQVRAAVAVAVAAHPALRMTIRDGRQHVHDDARFDWAVLADHALLDDVVRQPFDLATGPLVRAAVVLTPTTTTLLVACHHAVVDYVSLRVVLADIVADLVGDKDFALTDGAAADPRAWTAEQARHVATPEAQARLAALADRWRPARNEVLFPTPSAPRRRTPAAVVDFAVDADRTGELSARSTAGGFTPFVTVAAAYLRALHRVTGNPAVTIGTTHHGRADARFATTVGYLVNPVPLRGVFADGDGIGDVEDRTRRELRAALSTADLPFAHLVRALAPDRHGQNPVFQATLTYQQSADGRLGDGFAIPWSGAHDTVAGVGVTVVDVPPSDVAFALSLYGARDGDRTVYRLVYQRDLVDEAVAQRVVDEFRLAIDEALGRTERAAVPDLAAPTLGWVSNLAEGFARSVELFGDRTAIRYGDTGLTYRELDERVAALAGVIATRSVDDGPVGILLDRSIDMVVAALAIIRTGGSYVPVDPATPVARVGLILADAAPALVITTTALADRIDAVPVVLVDEPLPSAPPLPAEVCQAGRDSRAYVIFTSGTTGRPKGVQVTHGNLLRLFTATEEQYGFGPDDVWSLFHSFAFDFSVWEMWGPLLYGGCLVVVPREVATDPAAFRTLLRDKGVTVLNQTPTAFTQLIAEDARHADRLPLRHVIFGGEALRFADLRRWVTKHGDAAPRMVNMYGITETTVHASYRPVRRHDLDRTDSPVGTPLSDLDFVLVDDDLNPVPDGHIGEIVVTGPGVSPGYLNRPDLTAERFVTVRGTRGYRSGDLAVRAGGEYVYQGRKDDQVKIRGFRIELGEIQAALTGVPGVAQAAVVVDQPAAPVNLVARQPTETFRISDTRELIRGTTAPSPANTGPRIVAYVVGDDQFDGLFAHLSTHLPDYMVPAFVVAVAAIPLNHNGKVDTARLPAPTAANCLREQVSTVDETTASPAERAMCAIFEEVLGTTGVRPDDSFFAIGGDSIIALRLRSAALAQGVAIELSDLYALQTPRAITEAAHGVAPAETAAPVAPFAQISAADRALVPADVVDAYPVSTLQAGMLFHSTYQADVNMYCDVFMFRFGARYDHGAMRAAVDRAVAKHEMLRTSFDFTRYSEPLQQVHAAAHLPLTLADLRHLDAEAQHAELAGWREQEKRTPYDWAVPPLVRFAVHVVSDTEFQFAMSFHDATLDGWSESVMMTDILTEYWSLLHERPLGEIVPPGRRYADFIAAEREVLARPSAREYWANEMADVEPTPLPALAAGARDVHEGRMGFLSVDLPAELSLRLDELAGELRVSLKHVLVAVHARVQALLSGRPEVVLGIASNGRVAEAGGTDALGVHINLVPYRLTATGLTWTELARAVLAKDTELLATRGFPYAEIRRMAGVRGDLFDVSFNFTHFHGYEQLATATGIAVLDAKAYMQTSFALRVELNKDPFSRLLALDLEANMERVSAAQLHRIGELYRNAFEHVAAASQEVPTNRDLLGEDTYRELMAGFRGAVRPPEDTGFLARFAKSVTAHPDRVAAVCGDDSVMYADLATRVASCAGWLAARGVRAGDVVGLRAGRDIDYLVALMAVMRVGAVYLPLPAGPATRVTSMLRRGKAVLVLHDTAEATAGVDTALLADAVAEHAPYTGPLPGGTDGAYLIFTSGSTGEPKGALIRHDGMLNHVVAKVDVLGIAPGDRVSQDAAATFDISLWQWFSPLAVGATTVIYPDEISQDPPRLLRAVAEDAVTVLEVAPSVLSVFCAELAHYGVAAYPPFALRWVASSGEALKPGAANEFRRLLPAVRLLNMWGITETSDDTTHHEVTEDVDERTPSVPVGTPIDNTAVYVLDATGQPVPIGTPGELYVGGVAVGAGYVNDEARTAAAFVPDPFEPGATLYRTGDRGRQLAGGELEFLGRVDRQLKIRGQRVELGEVEAALATVPGVAESAVVVRTGDGETRLAGFYVTAVAARELSTADLRAALAGVLPRYAVPDFLVCLDELPRTPHGKVDTKELQRIDVLGPVREQAEVAPPATPTEAAVLDVIGAVLKVGTQDPLADFFELGGHSLHATHVMARLRDRFGVHLPLRLLFEHRTARGVAAAIDEAVGDWRAEEVTAHGIPARPADMTRFPLALNQASLWFLHQVDPDDRAYENVSLLHLRGPLDVAAMRHAVATMARRHEVLTVRFGDHGGVPYQTPAPGAPVSLEVVEVDGVTDPDAMIAHVRATDHRFDLAHGPLTIARLYRFGPRDHVFEWRLHHIVTDGWSSDVAMREIREAYRAHQEGRAPDLPDLRVQYADYARWQEDFLTTHAQQEENFWKSYLDGYDGVLNVATTHQRTPDRARTAGYATRTWDSAVAERIATFAADRHVTPFILGHAVTAVLMAKVAQQSDVVLGAVVAGRTVPETENLIGFFANTLPLRYSVDVTATPAALLSAVAASAVSAMENQLLPFGRIVESSGVSRTPGLAPLVQVLTTFDNFPFDMTGLPGLTSTIVQVPQETSRFDLLFRFIQRDSLTITVQYDATLFAPAAIEQLLDGVARLLDFFLASPDSSLTDAVLLSDDSRTALAGIWRDLTGTELSFDATTAETVLMSDHFAEFLDLAERRGLLTALLLAL
jgi:amino acid adenylation domain-containing protein